MLNADESFPSGKTLSDLLADVRAQLWCMQDAKRLKDRQAKAQKTEEKNDDRDKPRPMSGDWLPREWLACVINGPMNKDSVASPGWDLQISAGPGSKASTPTRSGLSRSALRRAAEEQKLGRPARKAADPSLEQVLQNQQKSQQLLSRSLEHEAAHLALKEEHFHIQKLRIMLEIADPVQAASIRAELLAACSNETRRGSRPSSGAVSPVLDIAAVAAAEQSPVRSSSRRMRDDVGRASATPGSDDESREEKQGKHEAAE